jgi:biotin operon repressor
MGIGESSVRSLLNSDAEARMHIAEKKAKELQAAVDKYKMIDVGVGVERELGISEEKLNQALEILKTQGYEVYGGRMPQVTNPKNQTILKVLCVPGTEHKDIFEYDKIHPAIEYQEMITRDDDKISGFHYPESLSSKRIQIKYAEDGGTDMDGVMELRPGVKDISLGNASYAQVRILVDGTHYLKGMAVYADDLPEGIDIRFNTNKKSSKPMLGYNSEGLPDDSGVLKPIKKDPDNPFGSAIKENGGQSYWYDDKGERHLSVINKRSEEGDWDSWSNTLSAQFLSKQPLALINKQLKLSEAEKQAEYDEIMSLTNPNIKKSLLTSFADDCDSSAVHLDAASLPGQKYKVILPLTEMKDNEVYNPSLENGTRCALVRYPHGGTFEIPILTVNNDNKQGRKMLGTAPVDAIGINSKVAERLSGADFDGDTVMCIPLNKNTNLVNRPPLKGLEGFDTKLNYGPDDTTYTDANGKTHYCRAGHEYRVMSEGQKQTQMGIVSNLITDMTLKGANEDELARAVRHSMVVIDAPKHHLDYKKSESDNRIDELYKTYQGHIDPRTGKYKEGASTLISQSKSEIQIPERKEGAYFVRSNGHPITILDEKNNVYLDSVSGELVSKGKIMTKYVDEKTGQKLYRETNRNYLEVSYKDKDGKNQKASGFVKDGNVYYKNEDKEYVKVTDEKVNTKVATMKTTRMDYTDDARTLISDFNTPQEQAYANYANYMKDLANKSRLEALSIEGIAYNPTAAKTYAGEVVSLKQKLNESLKNAPRERHAQAIANGIVKAKKEANPNMTKDEAKKLSQRELVKARLKVGAKRQPVEITDREWEAIQSGAISSSMLDKIINSTDSDTLRQLAMPRTTTIMSPAKINRAKTMANAGYTTAEIAKALGVSTSTITKSIK